MWTGVSHATRGGSWLSQTLLMHCRGPQGGGGGGCTSAKSSQQLFEQEAGLDVKSLFTWGFLY